MVNEGQVSKVKAFDISEINIKITNGKYHIHEDKPVSKGILRQWKKRGYNPNKTGIVHVRYTDTDKKYVFPLYFWIVRRSIDALNAER